MTATVLMDGTALVCPVWCDNAFTRRPHEVDSGQVLHRQSIDHGDDWRVYVVSAHDDELGEDELEACVETPADWDDASELARFAAAVVKAALLLARNNLTHHLR